MKLLIGAPIWRREWIIQEWLDHTVRAANFAGFDPEFLVVMDPRDPTCPILESLCRKRNIGLKQVFTEENREPVDKRSWTPDRLQHMVYLRNLLLKATRRLRPDFFLSLDSDILLHPATINNLINTQDERGWAGVGGKTFMTRRGTHAPSYAMMKRHSTGLLRSDSTNVMPVDVIMAIKLMTPEAYNINYEMQRHGEDIGWSLACKTAGLKLGWDGRQANKHVMDVDALGEVDDRVGF